MILDPGTPAPLVLPADGSTVWRLAVPGRGHRWLRARKGGPGYLVPAGWAAARCPYGEPPVETGADFADYDELRWLWRMTEAAPAWGWRLRPVTAGGRTAGWELVMEDPHGGQHCFTWLGGKLTMTRETVADLAGQLTGLSEAASMLT